MTGTHQSPINIMDRINTENDPYSRLFFLYYLEKDFAELFNKLQYDGRGLSMTVQLGDLIFTHGEDGTKETYKAHEIQLHYPSEHTITINSQTARYPLEIQIIHRLTKTTNKNMTNSRLTVKKAIVSLLFEIGGTDSETEDPFLSRLGIDERQRRPDGSYKVVDKGEYIDSQTDWLGNRKPGLDEEALGGLKDLINLDHGVYRYYGSDTTPPCNENVQRFVFKEARRISKRQVEFLREQLMKRRKSEGEDLELRIYRLYGNNRSLQMYDDAANGKVFSMINGIEGIEGLDFAKE